MVEKSLHAEGQGAAESSLYQAKQGLNNSPEDGGPAARQGRGEIRFTLGKQERLSREVLLNKLFDEGKSIAYHGFTLIYLPAQLPGNWPAQAAFSVPKRIFKKASDRNAVKRLMREAYRLDKPAFYEQLHAIGAKVVLMLVYKGKQMPDFAGTAASVSGLLEKLIQRISLKNG